jgi:hypothetical protein
MSSFAPTHCCKDANGHDMEVDWFTRSIAIYGAALATITGASQLWKDRVKVRVGAFYETISDAGGTRPTTLIVRATNVGRRSVESEGFLRTRVKKSASSQRIRGRENLRICLSPLRGLTSGTSLN